MSDHLSDKAREALALPNRERIQYIEKDRWIGYPSVNDALAIMEKLLDHTTILRMPNLLITAEQGNGKTHVANRFLEKHPTHESDDGSRMIQPVFYVQAPPEPNESRFYSNILEALMIPFKFNDKVEKKQFQVIHMFRQMGVKMLMIDEIHHFMSGSLNKHRLMLNSIKYLANELKIPIVAFGTKEAYRAIQTDLQLASRFDYIELPTWINDDTYLQLLMTLERIIPLKKPSNLIEPRLADRILALSGGTLGQIMKLIKLAAIIAVETEVECINHKVLDKLDWIPLTDRKYV